MDILLDTHVALFALAKPRMLGSNARASIADPLNAIYFSSASAWEVAIKNAKHPKDMPWTVSDFLGLCQKAGYKELPINSRHVQGLRHIDLNSAKPIHADPFDRILMSQAEAEGMQLLTKDRLMLQYDLTCILDASN